MEQIRNKEGSGIFRGYRGERTAAKGKDKLTENVDRKSDAKLKKTFKSTFKTANVGFIAWCVLMVITLICLPLVMAIGAQWIALIGAGAFLLGIPAISLALAAQTSNQAVRLDAKFKGKGRKMKKNVLCRKRPLSVTVS